MKLERADIDTTLNLQQSMLSADGSSWWDSIVSDLDSAVDFLSGNTPIETTTAITDPGVNGTEQQKIAYIQSFCTNIQSPINQGNPMNVYSATDINNWYNAIKNGDDFWTQIVNGNSVDIDTYKGVSLYNI